MPHEGSYIRWQSIALVQLGYAVGLILSFATASLGFALVVIKDQSYVPSCWGKAFMLASVTSLLLSIFVGVWCVINRLCDFRKTRRIARDREDWKRKGISEDEIDSRLAARRAVTKKLGKRSWRLFWLQIGTFGLGVAALAVAFAMVYRSKLF